MPKYDLDDSQNLSEIASQFEQIESVAKGEIAQVVKPARRAKEGVNIWPYVLGGVLLLAFAAGVYFVYRLATRNHTTALVTVPDVLGKPLDEARNAINNAHLRPQVNGAARSGTVSAMQPEPGSQVQPYATVLLFVTGDTVPTTGTVHAPVASAPAPAGTSAAPATPPAGMVVVPLVANLDADDAERKIKEVGLLVDVLYTKSPTLPDHTVISSDPAGGSTVHPGSRVRLFVNSLQAAPGAPISSGSAATAREDAGPPPVKPILVKIKDCAGLPAAEAMKDLTDQGLAPTQVTETSRLQRSGMVLKTTPAAGTDVAPGAKVIVVVVQ